MTPRSAPVRAPVMPDFCQPRRGIRQTMQAALKSLRALGVDEDRIRLQRIGRGWPTDSVVRQSPEAGTPLAANTPVVLMISAPAAVDALPFALREGGDDVIGTDRLMPVLDEPIAKLTAFIFDAGGFLELRPNDPTTGWRWIREIFRLDPGELPDDMVYALARFLPVLHRVAGTERGVSLGLHALFGLPMKSFDLLPTMIPLPLERRTRLGTSNGRLGVDAVVGDGVTVLARAAVTIGPVSLSQFHAHQSDVRRRQRDYLYRLVMPSVVLHPIEESWYVQPPSHGLMLGSAAEPLHLGVNSRFGQTFAMDASDG